MEKFIFWTIDCSFDYISLWGTSRMQETEDHGFMINFNGSGAPIIESIKGIGAFKDAENCKNLTDLYVYIEENKKYAFENLSRIEALELYGRLEKLQEKIKEILCKKIEVA